MPVPALDAVDLKILRLLQDDGRMSLADLAGKVGLSASPCLRRVRGLPPPLHGRGGIPPVSVSWL